MFTGIIEEIGIVRGIRKGGVSGSLTIGAREILSDVKAGDSIAVNGICLTVTGLLDGRFTVDVMHETFDRSCVGGFRIGTRVNLERAMAAGGRFGGHIVSGHIDGVGRILSVRKDENAVWYEIAAPQNIMRHIVEKGSVAIDGISLTVARAGQDSFRVSVIPHTENVTTMSEKKEGDMVNLENDCIGKYVEKLLTAPLTGQADGEDIWMRAASRQATQPQTAFRQTTQPAASRRAAFSQPAPQGDMGGVTEAFLMKNGYL